MKAGVQTSLLDLTAGSRASDKVGSFYTNILWLGKTIKPFLFPVKQQPHITIPFRLSSRFLSVTLISLKIRWSSWSAHSFWQILLWVWSHSPCAECPPLVLLLGNWIMTASKLLLVSIFLLRNTEWDTVASVDSWMVQLPRATFPSTLAWQHSPASSAMGILMLLVSEPSWTGLSLLSSFLASLASLGSLLGLSHHVNCLSSDLRVF